MSSFRHVKPHSRRARGDEQVRHWLEEGAAGQQSLFLELDPVLYALDADIARLAISRAHNYDGDERKPFAILAPPDDAVGWHLGMIARLFNLYLWTDTRSPELDLAIDHFGLEALNGSLQTELSQHVDFISVTDTHWENLGQLRAIAQQVQSALEPSGIGCLAFSARIQREALVVSWADGGQIIVQDLCRELGQFFSKARVESATTLRELDRFDRERVALFLKRHRDFFGKEAQAFLGERLADQDFTAAYTSADQVAVLIVVSGIGELEE